MVRKKESLDAWQKLDNTALLFPVIANETNTNVYRITAVLKEQVDAILLQHALDDLLPRFPSFNVLMRQGVFWYYFEKNIKRPPTVYEENDYPCRRMEAAANRGFLFRVTYFEDRIHLEAFHVLADGMGALTFLKELVYAYLRLSHPEAFGEEEEDSFSDDTSLNTEDSYVRNFKKAHVSTYSTKPALNLTGEKFYSNGLGVIHAFMSYDALHEVAHKYDCSVNVYLVSLLLYSIHQAYLLGSPSRRPIVVNVPVNLRPYYESVTTRNFFVMVSVSFLPQEKKEGEAWTLGDLCKLTKDSLHAQVHKEKLEEIFSYSVVGQRNLLLRSLPYIFKKIGLTFIYHKKARANTTTLTNLGKITLAAPYASYVSNIYEMLPVSAHQNLKAAVATYDGILTLTFTSVLKDASIQRFFLKQLAKEGMAVRVSTNGVYYE